MSNNEKELFLALKRIRHVTLSKSPNSGQIPQGSFYMLHSIEGKGKIYELEGEDSFKGITVSELSDILKVSKPAVSRMVSDLENKGYIRRITTKSDRRLVYVSISPQGKKMIEEAMNESKIALKYIIHELGEKDTEDLIRILNHLHTIIEKVQCEENERGDLI